ncbi:MAG TPA: YfhO family protein [Bryobacteraceae bacterium]|nr:YfhO family protein [Bryobacteraceae bacterium]
MAKKKNLAPAAELPVETTRPFPWRRFLWPALAFAVLLFYWTPLFDDNATIQWDAVDVHFSAQKYFEQSVRTTGLPHWTPFEFSGMPFLADPQSAAWYPIHWPFFAAGITPRAIQWELALHAFLALAGAFLFARKVLSDTGAALIAAIFYAFGGFFAEHSSHVGMFETAGLFPWLLWAASRAVESGTIADIVGSGLIAGLLVLAGHFQTALYSFFALALVLAVHSGPILRRVTVLISAAAIGFLIAAVQVLPGLELASLSLRAASDSHAGTNSPLNLTSLATLVLPNFYGALSGDYKGPGDITQFYFYGGLLLIPLAIAGFARRKSLVIPLALIVPALWYALGPGTGLYSLLTFLPGFKSVRAPVHIWFVIALGLSLAAGAGALWVTAKFRASWILPVLLIVATADLWHSNMSVNPLAYGHSSYAERYGNAYDNFQSHIEPLKRRPFYRIWSPYVTNFFGPLNSSLESRTEATYGYNPLELARYAHYMETVEKNPRLLNGLAVTNKMDTAHGAIVENPDVLARVSVPNEVAFASSPDEAAGKLNTLDPARMAIVEASPRSLAPSGATVQILNYQDDFYRVHYSAASDCLLRIAVPFFPGWTATIDGHGTDVLRVDYALSGVIVPAGDHELVFHYRSRWFRIGALSSILTAAACLGIILPSILRKRVR